MVQAGGGGGGGEALPKFLPLPKHVAAEVGRRLDPKWNDELIGQFAKSGINGRKIMENTEEELRVFVLSNKDPEFEIFPKVETNRALEMIGKLKAERKMLEKVRPIADPVQPLGGGGVPGSGFSCKPDVLTFSVNGLTKCSFASASLCNISGRACTFSVCPPIDGVFRIEPPSGVLRAGQSINLFVTMLHSKLVAASSSPDSANPNPQASFSFDCIKFLEGQGLRINIRHEKKAAAPFATALPPLSPSLFPPVQPGSVILFGNLQKVILCFALLTNVTMNRRSLNEMNPFLKGCSP
jgi:hypothetical protein